MGKNWVWLLVFGGLLVSGCDALTVILPQEVATPSREVASSSPTAVATLSPNPSATPTATPTSTPTATPTPTPTPTLQPTPDGFPRVVVLPILMYHHIGEVPPGADEIRRDLTVSVENFEEQLVYLQAQGYQTIALVDVIYYLTIGRPLPPKPIVLTFDDGYRDAYTQAFPLLQKYGFMGSFFPITSFSDEGLDEYLSWEQVAEMAEAGMEFGSHSKDHPDLRDQPYDFLVWQTLGSKESVEAHSGQQVYFFSYPAGRYDEEVIAVLASAGYWGALTEHQGALQSAKTPFELLRIRIRGSYEIEDFIYWLNYWLENPEGV